MQIFANGKRRFYSFVEFYLIPSRKQGGKNLNISSNCNIDINSDSHCNEHLQLKMINDRCYEKLLRD